MTATDFWRGRPHRYSMGAEGGCDFCGCGSHDPIHVGTPLADWHGQSLHQEHSDPARVCTPAR